MKLRLIYSLYIKDDVCNDEIYQLHYDLLTKYAHIFDEAIIIFVMTNNDYDIIFK